MDVAASTVTVTRTPGGACVTLNVNASTSITRRRAIISLASLLVGNQVDVKYIAGNLLAAKIEVK